MQNLSYKPSTDFIRVATATPQVSIANPVENLKQITALYKEASTLHAALLVFPELSLTGYSIQDLVRKSDLLNNAKQALIDFAKITKKSDTIAIVGLPLQVRNAVYNCAAVVGKGEIFGIVPKTNLPTYNEFYEKRWYQSWQNKENTSIKIGEHTMPFGTKQLFNVADAIVGIEICEDLWVADTPSTFLVKNGATIIVNPSASPELVAKYEYRKGLIEHTAARLLCGYIYASADTTESTSEIVMSGNAIINELGITLAERPAFAQKQRLLRADIDLQHIAHDRMKDTNFPNETNIDITDTKTKSTQKDLIRFIDSQPFVPKGGLDLAHKRFESILQIQAHGLAMRLKNTTIKKVILGLSGGLDSTLALLVAVQAATILEQKPSELIHTITMPGKASSKRTQSNAAKLARSLEIPNEEIPIASLTSNQLKALSHEGAEDTTYENTQARIRQSILFNKANQINGLVLGTGDLSEIALGWCTYNGDHMSHYNVNASIPKSLVRAIVNHAALSLPKQTQNILGDILQTPVSPELTGDGLTISQSTEDIIGPYELHDFFLYHFIRHMESPEKILFLAQIAFTDIYEKDEIEKWFKIFLKRFYSNQWKRQAMPDGVKVGISLSPRGDWRMSPETKIEA